MKALLLWSCWGGMCLYIIILKIKIAKLSFLSKIYVPSPIVGQWQKVSFIQSLLLVMLFFCDVPLPVTLSFSPEHGLQKHASEHILFAASNGF